MSLQNTPTPRGSVSGGQVRDPFFKSMAVVLVFGLTFATLLTLVIVPALYAIFFKVRADETT
jgi:multidrug efflux pump subunit AcrB